MGEIREMSSKGDTKLIWNPDIEAEVDAAKEHFNTLTKKKGFWAYAVKEDGTKGKAITEFDPKAAMIILVPRMQGG